MGSSAKRPTHKSRGARFDERGFQSAIDDITALMQQMANIALLPAESETETLTGDWTFSGDVTFGGTVTFTGSVIDHDQLTGLLDDDHTQYLLANGTRNVSGDLTWDSTIKAIFGSANDNISSKASGYMDYEANTAHRFNTGSLYLYGGNLYVGTSDDTAGSLHLRGHAAASDQGGRQFLYMAADHDATAEYYKIEVDQDDLTFSFGSGLRLQYAGGAGDWEFHADAVFGDAARVYFEASGDTAGTESIRSAANGYMDYEAATQHRFNSGSMVIGPDGLSLAASVDLLISDASPKFAWEETGVTVDNKLWDMFVDAETWKFRVVNDANSAAGNILVVNRTGTTVDSLDVYTDAIFGAGNRTYYEASGYTAGTESIWSAADGYLDFNSATAFRFNTGKVGIGAAAPSTHLHVASSGAAEAGVKIDATGGTGQAGIDLIAGAGATNRATRIDFLNGVASLTVPRWTILNDYSQNGTNSLDFLDASASRIMTLEQGGNIGINATNPAYKLQINGDVFVQDAQYAYWRATSQSISSQAAGYMDYEATTQHRFNTGQVVVDAGLLVPDTQALTVRDVSLSCPDGAGSIDVSASSFWTFNIGGNDDVLKLQSTSLTVKGGVDFALDTSTGSKIGTAANQKIGFFNATPVVQRAKASYNNWAALGDVVNALVALGLFDTA